MTKFGPGFMWLQDQLLCYLGNLVKPFGAWKTQLSSDSYEQSASLLRVFPFLVYGKAVCHWRNIAPFSATMVQDGLAERDQPGKNLLKYHAMAGI